MDLHQILRFYFITDDNAPEYGMRSQVEAAIAAGAGVIQYRHKSFSAKDFKSLEAIRDLCKRHAVPLIVNDHIVLAKAVDADGVHLGQGDDAPAIAREIMGPDAIIGISVSTIEELNHTDLSCCDYIGAGPVFATSTKADAKPVIGLAGLREISEASPLPVVGIGGIDDSNAGECFSHGATGIAVISCISRAKDPPSAAKKLGAACGCPPGRLKAGWNNEFALIDKLTAAMGSDADQLSAATDFSGIRVLPGDDAALFAPIKNPVVTTDTQKENIHFRRSWQTLAQIGRKAAEITFSDLAASFARPLSLFVNLSIPSYMSEGDIAEVYSGIRGVLEKYQASLGGGNISSGREFSIDLFVLGDGHPDIFPLRSNARPGDGLYVTGHLGLARAGLECLRRRETGFPELIDKFITPSARFDAAKILADHKVTCVMDISDGLAGDARHIAEASKLSVHFDLSCFKTAPELVEFCRAYQLDPYQMMLSGGEEYELLFACPPPVFEQIHRRLPAAFQVGVCTRFEGSHMVNLPEGMLSFQHGRK